VNARPSRSALSRRCPIRTTGSGSSARWCPSSAPGCRSPPSATLSTSSRAPRHTSVTRGLPLAWRAGSSPLGRGCRGSCAPTALAGRHPDLSMLLAFVLAALAFAGVVAPWQVIVLAFLLGVVNAFDAPARQAFVLEMVDRPVLTNAIALNSTMFNIAIAVGPAAGGIVYALFGPAWCFAINGISFVAVIGALLAMRLPPRPPRAGRAFGPGGHSRGLPSRRRQSRHPGAHCPYWRHEPLRHVLRHLIPAWAVKVLGGDARTTACCSPPGGRRAGRRAGNRHVRGRMRRGRLLVGGSIAFPVVLVLFSFTGPCLCRC